MSILAAIPAGAQDGVAVRQVDELSQCKAIAQDGARLACYDRAAATILASRASGELMVMDRKTVIARKQSRFGLATPTSDMFGGGKDDDTTQVRQIDTKIASVKAANSYGRWNLELANGSVWQTIDALTFPRPRRQDRPEGSAAQRLSRFDSGRTLGAGQAHPLT